MDSREIQDKSKLEYQRKQKGKIEPPPLLRIGEYHSQTGRYEVLFPNGGKVIAGNKLFNSSTPVGTPVRATQAFKAQSIALDYRRNYQPIPVAQEEDNVPLDGVMVWSSSSIIKGGYVKVAVDWFLGIYDRSDTTWLNSYSEADTMPDIAGKKLMYIPMPGKILSEDEINRLRIFRESGGIVFVTGEHAAFYSSVRQNANNIMQSLQSPLRCVDTAASYNPPIPYIVPVLNNFLGLTKLLGGIASCEISGGTPISVIPFSEGTPGTNIVWLSYDKDSRTILSGDVDWCGAYSEDRVTEYDVDNVSFAQALMNLQW